MNRTLVAREVRDELYAAEAAVEAALADSQRLLERMLKAREELGLTGTFGDTAAAQVSASIESLRQANATMADGHEELARLLKALEIKNVPLKAKVPIHYSADQHVA